jgi:hypothetical protein
MKVAHIISNKKRFKHLLFRALDVVYKHFKQLKNK